MFPSTAPLDFIGSIIGTAAIMTAIYFASRFVFVKRSGCKITKILPSGYAWLALAIPFFLFYTASGISIFGIVLPISRITLIEYNAYVIASNTTEIFCYVVAALVPWIFNWPEGHRT